MTLRTADRAHRVRMPGLIVHQSNAGVGLMFRRSDGEAAEVLSWLLSADEPETPRPAAGLVRLEHGFLRVRCEVCHQERLVAFRCKRRGFCPRCGARHTVESAALI
jgi:ribosomal protein S27E